MRDRGVGHSERPRRMVLADSAVRLRCTRVGSASAPPRPRLAQRAFCSRAAWFSPTRSVRAALYSRAARRARAPRPRARAAAGALPARPGVGSCDVMCAHQMPACTSVRTLRIDVHLLLRRVRSRRAPRGRVALDPGTPQCGATLRAPGSWRRPAPQEARDASLRLSRIPVWACCKSDPASRAPPAPHLTLGHTKHKTHARVRPRWTVFCRLRTGAVRSRALWTPSPAVAGDAGQDEQAGVLGPFALQPDASASTRTSPSPSAGAAGHHRRRQLPRGSYRHGA